MATAFSLDSQTVDTHRRVYTANRPLHLRGEHRFLRSDDLSGAPVAEAVLAVKGVSEVVLSDCTVSVTKSTDAPWDHLDESIRYAIVSAVAGPARAPSNDAVRVESLDDDQIYDMVADLFEREINPSVARHGGRVDLIDIQDATVILRMQGGCQGCGMASVTLKQGIEGTLKRALPGLKGIQDITDHAAGTKPYFEGAPS